jgi:ATP synthase F1 delta subunit
MKTANATILAQAVLDKLEAGESAKKVSTSLAAYLIEERRVSLLKTILREIQRLQLQGRKICYVQVTSAYPLAPAQLTQIKSLFKNKNNAGEVVIEQTIDKDVIGGVRCETADQLLDLTVRRQLQRLTRS